MYKSASGSLPLNIDRHFKQESDFLDLNVLKSSIDLRLFGKRFQSAAEY